MKHISDLSSPLFGGEPKRIVVIGGGAVGALTAFELQRAGHKVTLLEARSWGNGSSSRSAACIRAQFDNPSTVRGMVYCEEYYKQWAEVVGGIHSPITQNGYLFLKDLNEDMDAVRRVVEMQRSAGLSDVEILTRGELDVRFPYLETTGIQGATWCPSDGFLDPALVYGDAAEMAQKLGATTMQNVEVVGVIFENGRPISVKTADGREFTGDIFVNACGVWAPKVSAMFDGYPLDIKARRRYLHFLAGFNGRAGDYMSAEDFGQMPMIITPRRCYSRPESRKGSQLMMGWMQPAKPVRPEFGNQDEVEEGFGRMGERGTALRKEVGTYVPDIEHMGGVEHVTTGFYEDTPDHNPLIGFDPWTPNLVHAAGFSGHGLMHAPFTAAAVVNLVAAGKNLPMVCLPLVGDVDIGSFAVDRVWKTGEGMVI
ncbi:MAG: FAD-binding oxidoreductase [bacterium]|nr:FAD-binding oxidoreductase [bacterium]